jgi:hypothetical protein
MTGQTDPLLDVIDRLTIEHTETTRKDDGTNWYSRHDGLIKQLRDAVASDVGGGGAGGKDPRERIPLDADAMVKYQQIEEAIGQRFQDRCEGIPGEKPEENLRVWFQAFTNAIRSGQVSEESYLDEVRTLEAWARVIDSKLSPPTQVDLFSERGVPEECPDCGAGWYEVILNSGKLPKEHVDSDGTVWKHWYEKERRVALSSYYTPNTQGTLTESFVKCGCCGHVWMGVTGIRALAYELETKAAESEETA